ncbi:MAG: PDZ domain-containing protein [Chloroflexi bacterium]|nr:PDZ domain-containing protein [Chloroflexota bacterium]
MKMRLVLPVAMVALALAACEFSTLAPPTPVPTQTASAAVSLPQVDLAGQQDVLIAIYESVSPGVVAITANSTGNPLSQLGSGWVYDRDGYIVTNNHVVEGATEFEVDFVSGYKAYATLVGVDPHSDLAVIKVDAPPDELHPLALGDTGQLKVGQVVLAIGNPFGFSSTMTTGIVSALGRALPSDYGAPSGGYFSAGDVIQTDAALNPGNSGGPLLNLAGEVVGVNQSIYTTTYTETGEPVNSGIGFAVSVNIVKRVVPSIIASGKYDYPYLGISSIDDFSLQTLEALGLERFTGAYVTAVTPGGPADKAGLRAGDTATGVAGLYAGGDLIIAIDGREVMRFDDLISYLYTSKAPGETVMLTVLRGAEQLEIRVELGYRP